MKKIVTVTEVENEGFMAFMGKRILIMAQSFFYDGILSGVNEKCVLLEDAYIVLSAGDFQKKGYDCAEKIDGPCYVAIPAVESFMSSKR
jgi:hypothetical protein